ncbi:MAG: hypothetical protein HC783_17160 [Rhodobacteraceae bacterium]|nr:hypothetical protein [Paracoccaceae bacterium]
MAEPLSQILLQARSRWMIGGDAPVPEHPLTSGQGAAEANLRLLAIAGQYSRIQDPPRASPLTVKPDLPRLGLPVLPEVLRPIACRLLADKADRAPLLLAVFAAKRGHVLHPADWMPPPNAELPEVYRPLQLWQADRTAQAIKLTAETWLDFTKAERLVTLRELRASDPPGALGLLSEHLAACPAEERLALVEALGSGLSTADVSFLAGLANDRSEKVRKAAAHLLARLGHVEADPLAAEAAAMFDLATEGMIRRRKVLRISAKAKEAQLRSLAQTLPDLSLQGISQALGLTPAEFVTFWQPEKVGYPVQAAVSEMILRTAVDADLVAYWHGLCEKSDFARNCLPTLFPRLPVPDQQAALLWLVTQFGLSACQDLVAMAVVSVPPPVSAALTNLRKDLVDLLRLSRDTTPEKAASARAEGTRLANHLSQLGFLVTADDAAVIVQTLTTAGIHQADPILDRLIFNAALKGH